MFVPQRQFVIPTALPAVGVQGADLLDENNGEVHVYAHPSKVVNNLQHPKEREKVRFILSPIFFFYTVLWYYFVHVAIRWFSNYM